MKNKKFKEKPETSAAIVERFKGRVKRGIKKAAVIGTAGALLLAVLIPIGLDSAAAAAKTDSGVMNPAPIVMQVDDIGDAAPNGQNDAEEEKKLPLGKRLKLAVYGFFGAIAAWIAAKIPWKKIFSKRSLIILLALAALGLAGYYIIPGVWSDCPWEAQPLLQLLSRNK